MSTTTENQEKYIINCQDGANHVERASIAFVLAVTASKENEAVVFLTSDAAFLCVKGRADGPVHEGMEPLADLINQFVSNGGTIWLCPVCAKVKGIQQSDLIEGAELGGAPRTMAFIANGGKVLF